MLAELMLAVAVATASAPRPAPTAFASQQYGLTFRIPPDSFYCGLAKDWVGSDHGTIVFLAPPTRCLGAGFPSSSRGWGGFAPHIEVFYGYDLQGDERPKVAPCKRIAQLTFFGRSTPLCRNTSRGLIQVSASAKYEADVPVDAVLTLVTSRRRLDGDLDKFKGLLRSARTCRTIWHGGTDQKSFTTGSGPPCPRDASWF